MQPILDAIARVVGGTAPDATNRPRFFSGDQAGDGSGVAGLKGCYSSPVWDLQDTPMGIVLPGKFQILHHNRDVYVQGTEINAHNVRLQICVPGGVDPETEFAILTPFIDSVPAAFAAHMGLYGAANVIQAFPVEGDFVTARWGGQDFFAYQFTIRVHRDFIRTYSA